MKWPHAKGDSHFSIATMHGRDRTTYSLYLKYPWSVSITVLSVVSKMIERRKKSLRSIRFHFLSCWNKGQVIPKCVSEPEAADTSDDITTVALLARYLTKQSLPHLVCRYKTVHHISALKLLIVASWAQRPRRWVPTSGLPVLRMQSDLITSNNVAAGKSSPPVFDLLCCGWCSPKANCCLQVRHCSSATD